MRLADFILQNLDRVAAKWEAFAGTLFESRHQMTPLALRDHVKQIMEARAPRTPELRELERGLAYECAVADLESLCGLVDDPVPGSTIDLGVSWWDTLAGDDFERGVVERAVRYLELRGLLARHPECDHFVRPLALPSGDN
jgi:hypothetical protein